MTKYQLHEDCKLLSTRIYPKNRHLGTNGWKYQETISNSQNGFYSEVYTKNGKAILVIRGTEITAERKEILKDGFNDAQMDLGFLPWQMTSAENAYLKTVNKYGKNNVILTGHSLGGSETQILGAKYGVETITFGAYGTGNISDVEINYTSNITNYGNAQDGIFVRNIDNQIGKTKILNTDTENNTAFNENIKYHNVNPHKIENFGDLSKGIEYKKEIFENEKFPLLKIGIEYNKYNPEEVFNTSNRVLYKGELNPKDIEVGSELEDLFVDYWSGEKPWNTKKDLDKRVRIGELIYVNNYTRSDGTKVSGYYRAYPTNK